MKSGEVRPDLTVVANTEGRGSALKQRIDKMGVKIVDLRAEILERTGTEISREQLGKILSDKVPNARAFEVIEQVVKDLEEEAGLGQASTVYATGVGQVTIVAEGVFGVGRLTVSGTSADAEATMARLIADIRSGAPVKLNGRDEED